MPVMFVTPVMPVTFVMPVAEPKPTPRLTSLYGVDNFNTNGGLQSAVKNAVKRF